MRLSCAMLELWLKLISPMVSLQTWRSYKMDTLVGWKSINWHGILFTYSHPRNEKTQITKSFIFFCLGAVDLSNKRMCDEHDRCGWKKWTIQILCFQCWVLPKWCCSFHAQDQIRKEYQKKSTKKLNINPRYYLSQILGDSLPKSPTWLLDFGGSWINPFLQNS